MLSFLNQHKNLPRTYNPSQNPLVLEGGRCTLEFHRSKEKQYFMTGTVPPRLESEMPDPAKSAVYPPQTSSAVIPPLHWHARQDEEFLIISGRMVATLGRKQHIVEPGGIVPIPKGTYHTFANASAEEKLVFDVKLDPDYRERDEAFFRNAYGYLDDCDKAGTTRSPFQAFVFLYNADIIPAMPGPRFIMAPLSKFIVWAGALVGEHLLGYQVTYPEYTPKDLL